MLWLCLYNSCAVVRGKLLMLLFDICTRTVQASIQHHFDYLNVLP